MPRNVAVIGGCPLGLMAAKNLEEDGFAVTLFESRAWVGGLWKYSQDESLSVADNTIFNSSKYRSAISDFPVPDDKDDFPTAPQLHKCFESYCDHFDLWPHIRLSSPINVVRREGKQWTVESASGKELFDKVVISCGSFTKPRQPTFEGIERLQGSTLHAINLHDASQYVGWTLVC